MAASTRLGLVFKCCQVFQPSPITCDQSNSRHDKHFHVLQEGHACTKAGMIVVGVFEQHAATFQQVYAAAVMAVDWVSWPGSLVKLVEIWCFRLWGDDCLIGQIPVLALPPGGLPGIPLGMTSHNNLKKSAAASIYQFMSEVLLWNPFAIFTFCFISDRTLMLSLKTRRLMTAD